MPKKIKLFFFKILLWWDDLATHIWNKSENQLEDLLGSREKQDKNWDEGTEKECMEWCKNLRESWI